MKFLTELWNYLYTVFIIVFTIKNNWVHWLLSLICWQLLTLFKIFLTTYLCTIHPLHFVLFCYITANNWPIKLNLSFFLCQELSWFVQLIKWWNSPKLVFKCQSTPLEKRNVIIVEFNSSYVCHPSNVSCNNRQDAS